MKAADLSHLINANCGTVNVGMKRIYVAKQI